MTKVVRGDVDYEMSRNIRKGTFGLVRPAKLQISLCIRVVWSESPVFAFWIAEDFAKFLHGDNEDWWDCVDAMAGEDWFESSVDRTCQEVHFPLRLKLRFLFYILFQLCD